MLLTEGGDWDKLGRGTQWNDEIPNCIHQNHVFRVRVNDGAYLPEFVAACLASPQGKEYFQSSSKQTTNLASINQKQLKAFQVPFIDLKEQRQLLAALKRIDQANAGLVQLQGETSTELQALPSSILAQAFAGAL